MLTVGAPFPLSLAQVIASITRHAAAACLFAHSEANRCASKI
jgi:hypothetical protein